MKINKQMLVALLTSVSMVMPCFSPLASEAEFTFEEPAVSEDVSQDDAYAEAADYFGGEDAGVDAGEDAYVEFADEEASGDSASFEADCVWDEGSEGLSDEEGSGEEFALSGEPGVAEVYGAIDDTGNDDVPGLVEAGFEDPLLGSEEVIYSEVVEESPSNGVGVHNNYNLFEEYVDKIFYSSSDTSTGTGGSGSGATTPGSRLEAKLAAELHRIAAGERRSTEFSYQLDELNVKTEWTTEELGISISDNNSEIIKTAEDAIITKTGLDIDAIAASLKDTYSCEFYWLDTRIHYQYIINKSYSYEGPTFQLSGNDKIIIEGPITIRFDVDEDYRPYSGGKYEVDTTIGSSVITAKQNADAIIEKYKGLNDIEKLRAYLNEICSRASYHNGAAQGVVVKGTPRLMVDVFNGTRLAYVLSEAYSKAFRYLCCKSTFQNVESCISVDGTVSTISSSSSASGAFMWNIVRMKEVSQEGTILYKNYLVDIAMCDDGHVGSPDQLFLALCDTGSPSEGYTFKLNNNCTASYVYSTNTRNNYSEDKLTIDKKAAAITRTITFKIVNGYWETGGIDDKTVVLKSYGNGDPWLNQSQIPKVGDHPAVHYKAGSWNETPNTTSPITEDKTYIYTYVEQIKKDRNVTFKVVHGSWNDGTTEDKVVTQNLYEKSTMWLKSGDIPAVGSKPDNQYKAGVWDVIPNTVTGILSDKIYTYTYIPESSISAIVTFKVVNGSWDDETTEDKQVSIVGTESDPPKLTATQIPEVGTKPDTNCEKGSWDETPSLTTGITSNKTYTYTYKKKDSSYTVTFKVVNGSWNDGTTANKTVTLTGKEGETLKLSSSQIPTVGDKPNDKYKAGSWDTTPSTSTAITKDVVYTYTYVMKDLFYLTLKSSEGASASPTANKSLSTGYEAKTEITITAADPKSGYEFEGWYEGGTLLTTSKTYNYVLNKTTTLEAVYTKVVTITAADDTVITGDAYTSRNKVSVSGLKSGDTESKVLDLTSVVVTVDSSYNKDAAAGSKYTLTPSGAKLKSSGYKLEYAAGTLTVVEDTAADTFVKNVNALTTPLTSDDSATINGLLKEYEALLDFQKNKDSVKEAKALLDDAKAAVEVIAAIEAIDIKEGKSVSDARKLYESLTDEQKSYIIIEDLDKLEEAEAERVVIDKEAAEDFTNIYLRVFGGGAGQGAAYLKWSLESYDKLSDEQKSYLDKRTRALLDEAEEALKKDRQFRSGSAYYKVLASGDVTYLRPASKDIKSATVPNQVKKGKFLFKVVAISELAFDGCENLEWVLIHKNVTTIGAQAFRKNSKLSKIKIKGTGLKKGHVVSAFTNVGTNVVVKVPKKKVDAYRELFKGEGKFRGTVKA